MLWFLKSLCFKNALDIILCDEISIFLNPFITDIYLYFLFEFRALWFVRPRTVDILFFQLSRYWSTNKRMIVREKTKNEKKRLDSSWEERIPVYIGPYSLLITIISPKREKEISK